MSHELQKVSFLISRIVLDYTSLRDMVLLVSFRPVHCRKVRSTLKALQEIEKEMNHPWSHLANLQPRFILVGSIGEGTRLGAFSELDFTVEFRGLNKSARLLLDSNNDATKLNIEGVQAKEKLARFCNRGFFDFATFLRHFLLAVWLAVDAARHRNAFPEEMALNPEVFNPCPQCFMLTESKYQESIYVPFSHCCQCLPAVTHTKLGACLFLQYKREGHEVAVVSVDLVPVFPLRAESVQDVLGLFDVVTKTLMTKKIPFWTEYYQVCEVADLEVSFALFLRFQRGLRRVFGRASLAVTGSFRRIFTLCSRFPATVLGSFPLV